MKPAIAVQNISVHFPMHLDQQTGNLRNQLGRLICGRGVERRYHLGLHNVSLTAEPGDRIGLVGRNGSGKTTLLRTLAGIYEPDSGHIERFGKTVSLINLTMGMDVYETGVNNIYRRAALFGISGDEADALLADVAEFSELGSFLNEPIRTYSSGMMARLSFAIATSIHANIILMDEWISAGDQRFIEAAERRMDAYFSGDRIIFLASHSAALVRKWCNRLIVMDRGEVIMNTTDVIGGIADFHKLLAEDDGSR